MFDTLLVNVGKAGFPKYNIVALSVKKEVTIATNAQVKLCRIQFNISQMSRSP